MSSVKCSQFLIVNYFKGEPNEDDFSLTEIELSEIQDGEFRAEALCWSVDPYMRSFLEAMKIPLGSVMIGRQVSRVTASKNPDYAVGDVVFGNFGWRTHTNVKPGQYTELEKLTDFNGLPYSLALGVLGKPGHSAYFGFLEICQPKQGETVVISGAAGAVGSHVGQIAKIKGCKVIGFAGSDEKVKWLLNDLKFDYAYNYKKIDVQTALKESAQDGVDCYFDNVGGVMSSIVLANMRQGGRISVCGSISSYNATQPVLAPYVQRSMISKGLRMEGFLVYRWTDRFYEAVAQNIKWIKEDKLQYKETEMKGFENLPKAFLGLFKGENIGKYIVKV